MFRKNTSGQFIHFQGVDSSTGGIKSGVSWTVRRCIDGTFAAVTGTVTEDGTSGWYKFAMSQADTNGNNIGFNFTGTGAVPQTINILTDGSPPDVNLKNAAGTAVTLDANNVLNVSTKYLGGTLQTARDIGASVLLSAGTGTGQLDFTSGVVKANATQWLGGTIPAVNVTGVPLVDLKYTLGTISPATAGSVRADSVTGAVGSVTGAVGSVTGAVGSVTGNVGGNVVGSVGSVTGLTASNLDTTVSSRLASASYTTPPTAAQNFSAVCTTQLTESYASLHTVPTLAQLMLEIRALLAEKSVGSTTLTAKKIDGSTTAGTYTLDSATAPTSITRAS